MSAGRDLELLSVVAPVYQEEDTVERFCAAVAQALRDIPYELVLVDDGSTDQTWSRLERLAELDRRIKLLRLSRNFGHQAALTAGLDHASGGAVVMLDSDLQDPPGLIPTMLERWRAGADVVYGVRRSRPGESRFKLATARLFYRVFHALTSVGLESDSGDFRLLDRTALDALLALRERSRFLRGMSIWVGFTQTSVPYDRDPRYAGETKFTLGRMLRFSFDAVASFSYRPLQLATALGFLISTITFLAIPVVVVLKLTGHYLYGFSTVEITILLLGGIQLITIGAIGEYVGRIFDEVKGRPLYLVRSRHNLGSGAGGAERSGAEPTATPPDASGRPAGRPG
ncbi:MAG TPA: glycosyltransferase family 2 protein [Solirubrobacteraceae bacterium]|nr:glycosyltransferase family 2 protein [Solirubrobacteraceae bacterium]